MEYKTLDSHSFLCNLDKHIESVSIASESNHVSNIMYCDSNIESHMETRLRNIYGKVLKKNFNCIEIEDKIIISRKMYRDDDITDDYIEDLYVIYLKTPDDDNTFDYFIIHCLLVFCINETSPFQHYCNCLYYNLHGLYKYIVQCRIWNNVFPLYNDLNLSKLGVKPKLGRPRKVGNLYF